MGRFSWMQAMTERGEVGLKSSRGFYEYPAAN